MWAAPVRVGVILTLATAVAAAAAAGLPAMAAQPAAAAAPPPTGPYVGHDIRPGAGVTRVVWLSEYHPPLRGTPGDTRVYILEGDEPGGTVFVAGGTHGNEIAGIMAAIALVEKARVTAGRLIVVPHANNSAITWTTPDREDPDHIWVVTASGPRSFRYGARYTNPAHQSPDPEEYVHPLGYTNPGHEARNLDRVHPGKPDGTLTEQISYALVQLLRREEVDLAFDLHEAGTRSRLANMLIANPKGLEIGALAVLQLESTGIVMKLEHSSQEFRGLSHREWGDHTQAYAFLIETPNPGQDPDRRKADVVNDPDYPLAVRVGYQLETVRAVVEAFNGWHPDRAVRYEAPGYEELRRGGLAAALN